MALLGDIYGYGDANGIYVDVSSGVFMARSGTKIAKTKLYNPLWLDQAEKARLMNITGVFFQVLLFFFDHHHFPLHELSSFLLAPGRFRGMCIRCSSSCCELRDAAKVGRCIVTTLAIQRI